MNVDAAHKSGWAIAEVIFGIPFLLGIALQFLVPFSFPQGVIRQLLVPVGILLILAGAAIIVMARREFARYAQPTDPGRVTSQIIKTGVFSVSRNPLYLGTVGVNLGLVLAFNWPWVLGMLLLAIVLCRYSLIAPEERYLANKFGTEYEQYTQTVNRWLGRTKEYKSQNSA